MTVKAIFAAIAAIAVSATALLPAGIVGDDATLAQPGGGLAFAGHEEADRVAAHAVIAHIDTGINPYHAAFRDDSPLAWRHPSTYIPGYPEDAEALHLTLDAPTVEKGLEADADAWAAVERGKLYWIPGTRIIGAISLVEEGGCLSEVEECTDVPLLDEHGHGTMTASRMAGAGHSLAPAARIVSIEGLGGEGVRWAADQGWVDVQTNSWLSFYPPPAGEALGDDTTPAFRHAAAKHVVFAASGNGAAYVTGFAPTPTYALSTAAPGVILVGAHDNGRVAPWSGAPAHVVADGYGGFRASHTNNTDHAAHPMACCTSAASPYAAGAAAALIQEARSLLGDTTPGVADGVLAEGDPGNIRIGPLADGALNVTEVRRLVLATAEPRPLEGRDDGLLHWMGTPGGRPGEHADRWGPGANPFCQGCVTLPARWSQVDDDAPAHHDIGYGAVNERSLADALAVLQGHAPLPERAAEDAFFAKDQALRDAIMGEPPAAALAAAAR